MEFADFAVEMEEAIAKVSTNYECTMVDKDEIAIGWHFLYEDALEGFLVCEHEDETFGFPTVTIALKLANVTGVSDVIIKALFELNMTFINVSLALLQLPVEPSEEEELDDDELQDEADEEEINDSMIEDSLVIRTKIPYEQFQPSDFEDYVKTLAGQAEIVFEFLDSIGDEE